MGLARQFFDLSPQSAGIISNDIAYVTFKSQDRMDQFITIVHGSVLQTGEILSVEICSQGGGNGETEEGNEKRKRKKRAQRKKEVRDGRQ